MNTRMISLSLVIIVTFSLVVVVYQANRTDRTVNQTGYTHDQSRVKPQQESQEVLSQDELDKVHLVNSETMTLLQEKLLALQTQTEELESQLRQSMENSQMSEQGNAANTEPVSGGMRDEVAIAAKARADMLKQMNVIENNFQSQDVDPVWSQGAESSLQNAFANQDLSGHSLQNVECKSSLCKIDVVHQGDADVAGFRFKLRDQVSDVLPAGAIMPNGAGGSRVYLAADPSALAGR